MKYLNEESQFTRVSDAHAKSLMESAGYEVPSEEEVHVDVYAFEDARFALAEEVVTGADGLHYVRLQELDENFTVTLDASGEEILVESVKFEDVDYVLEGVFEDEEGNLYACMLSEAQLEERRKKAEKAKKEDEKAVKPEKEEDEEDED